MTNQPGRNDPCTCGSGKKYKKCCGRAGLKRHTATVISSTTDSLLSRISQIGAEYNQQMSDKVINVSSVKGQSVQPVEKTEEKQTEETQTEAEIKSETEQKKESNSEQEKD